jgi:ATP-GRASP peptide maturase of grasp-with-spasm system
MVNKVLIISDPKEPTTDLIIDWLIFYKVSYIRLSETQPITVNALSIKEGGRVSLEFSTYDFQNNPIIININEISSIWYRRSKIKINQNLSHSNSQSNIFKELFAINRNEIATVETVINYILKQNFRESVNNYLDNDQNKIINLIKAEKHGLKTPKTLVTSNRLELEKFYKECRGNVITKPSSQGAPYGGNSKLNIYTKSLSWDEICSLPKMFPISTFQENVIKQFELRIFYLHEAYYPMAIFSQNDDQTKVDFRNYNIDKPNRTVPFILPLNIKNKLKKLMLDLELNCGSIDLLVNLKNEFIFLEVNPVGQFVQVSEPCNYKLEKKIAKCLRNGKNV